MHTARLEGTRGDNCDPARLWLLNPTPPKPRNRLTALLHYTRVVGLSSGAGKPLTILGDSYPKGEPSVPPGYWTFMLKSEVMLRSHGGYESRGSAVYGATILLR